jgi:hypothetical protein
VNGGFRSQSVLNKPFSDVANETGLGKRFTQRGLILPRFRGHEKSHASALGVFNHGEGSEGV